MNKRTLPIAFVAVALALAVLANRGPAAEGAARKTPTPIPSPTPTALPLPTWSPESPVPPDGLRVDCLGMYWNDKSDNEDGFFIDLIVCGGTPFEQRLQYEVPENTTEFLFPQEYFEAGKACPNSFAEEWGVGAFNSYGRTGGSRGHGPIIKCAKTPTAAPTAVVVLPPAGESAVGGGDGPGWWQAALLAGGVVSLGAVVLALYGGFAACTVYALLRRRRNAWEAGERRAWQVTALGMALFPVASAVAIVTILAHTESIVLAEIALFNALGGLLIAGGLLLRSTLSSTWLLVLRLCGWSLLAGVALIPSFLVFLLPVPSLLAFLVPGDYEASAGRRRTSPDAIRM